MKRNSLTCTLNTAKQLAIFYLSAKMICFAIPKLLFMQFRTLHYEAFIPLAEISSYQHMWSFFGRSYNYNLFIGMVELIIGALVIFRKTRLIALIIALGVCLNILILNIEFDIVFAIPHITLDLVITLLLLAGYRKDLYRFFITLGGQFKVNPTGGSQIVHRLKYLYLLALPLGYTLYAMQLKQGVNDQVVGSYQIDQLVLGNKEEKLSRGKYGSSPLIFFEYNNQVVLSVNDSLYFGGYTTKDNNIFMYFKSPAGMNIRKINGQINDDRTITGRLNDSIPLMMKIGRLSGQQDYLNELYLP